jgi:hypothetical protein
VKTKLLVVVLLIVSFSLAGALYATAAPGSSPEIRALKAKVGKLEGRLILAEFRIQTLGCKTNYIWEKAAYKLYSREYTREVFPDFPLDRLSVLLPWLPACVA